jgi:hypothetical protein
MPPLRKPRAKITLNDIAIEIVTATPSSRTVNFDILWTDQEIINAITSTDSTREKLYLYFKLSNVMTGNISSWHWKIASRASRLFQHVPEQSILSLRKLSSTRLGRMTNDDFEELLSLVEIWHETFNFAEQNTNEEDPVVI